MIERGVLSGIAIGLTFVGFVPYIRAIRQHKTKPHVFSWVIWGSSTFIAFLAQLSGGGGVGAWPIGVSGLISLYIAILAYSRRADSVITRQDWWFLLAAMSSLPLWYFTSDPLWAVVVLTAVDVIGFGPTLRKAYVRPHEENLVFFAIFAVRNAVAVAALEQYTLTTVLFPVATGLACVTLVAVVGYRRQAVRTSSG
ncbi:hypothetical protein CAI21_10720 [Alkalilimnicola ehrlichii]|uniref:Uncharacterized protein n=1 Tax=Alkalilimnicola ehrlichii TaxID=351052 RepID=A0A3E0WVD6_9GAMM|nr:hypothetical protein [Alkalilimnicola ehrlichii]RFA29230.1 hypothetical protein CAI21_10720 [Alkalilimnicola ehrlichii]RFA36143.1 hypothetical protein CAL65_11875 [Alkalilimnicola ehrlichii]